MAFQQSGDKLMTYTSPAHGVGLFNLWRLAGWATIAGLIALPGIAMQFTTEVNWGAEDFVFAVVMLGGVGLAFELAVRASGSWAYRGGAAVALGSGLLLLWGNAAVGIVGNEENDLNMWFNAVPVIALIGATVARLRANRMAVAMSIAALAQIAAGVIVQLAGHSTWIFTIVWAAGWTMSAWLFRRAAQDR
jgi:hypothetical protein